VDACTLTRAKGGAARGQLIPVSVVCEQVCEIGPQVSGCHVSTETLFSGVPKGVKETVR